MQTCMQDLPFDPSALRSLAGGGQPMEPAMKLALEASFGSAERWRDTFVACGKALAGRSGWVLLAFAPGAGMLVNQCAADHPHAIAGAVPILALDGVEHVWQIDWAAVYRRYQAAVHAASDACGVAPDELGDAQLLDVRRAGVFEQAGAMLPGARWRDPANVAVWAGELPTGRDVVVYCVHGHEVSRATALHLRAAGVKARYLRGGISAWQAAGRPLLDKPAP